MTTKRQRRVRAGAVLGALLLAACGGGDDEVRRLTPLEHQIYLLSTPVATALVFDRVARGDDSSCMLTAAGEAWCWGNNEFSPLGAATARSCSGGNIACTWQPVVAGAGLSLRWFGRVA